MLVLTFDKRSGRTSADRCYRWDQKVQNAVHGQRWRVSDRYQNKFKRFKCIYCNLDKSTVDLTWCNSVQASQGAWESLSGRCQVPQSNWRRDNMQWSPTRSLNNQTAEPDRGEAMDIQRIERATLLSAVRKVHTISPPKRRCWYSEELDYRIANLWLWQGSFPQ